MNDNGTGTLSPDDPETRLFLDHYERWRKAYAADGRPPRNAPVWQAGKLYLRENYPHQDWSAYAFEQGSDGKVTLLTVSTERRIKPHEAVKAVFSSVALAGKYVLLTIGDYLRIQKRLDPVAWRLREAGLSPAVEKTSIDEKRAEYALKDDPTKYFITGARGISWNNWLLVLSYEDLNRALAEGFPESLAALVRLDSDS